MSIRLSSHLHRNRYGVYGFRIVIPRDLRLSFPRREIRISLRTTSRTAAKPLALRFTLLTQNYFDKIRRSPSFDEALATGKELIQALGAGSFDELTSQLSALIPEVEGESGVLLRKLVALRNEHSAIEAAKQACLMETVYQLEGKSDTEIDSLFCDMYANVTPLVIKGNQLSAEVNDLMLHAQRALQGATHSLEVQAIEESKKAEINSITDLAAEIAFKATLKAASVSLDKNPPNATTAPKSEQLATIVEAYCANQISEGSWTTKTESENRSIFALWLRVVGDQPILNYGFEQHRDYKSTLSKLPPNMNKSPRYRDKNIAEILRLNATPAAPNTINKNLVRISALFDWARKYGFTELNPARGMTIKNPKRPNEQRQIFSDDELRKLLNSPEYIQAGHRHPYQFWIPLIALYSGARLNEICQLHLCDFDEKDGIKVIRISEEGGRKRLKTKAANRLIPIHSDLIRLGLIDFVDSLRRAGQIRLFPELKERRDGYGQTASKWFASYCTRCGIDEAGKVFHSFRHTVIDRLKQSEVPKEKIAALVGHEDDSVTFGRYGKAFKPETLWSVVNLLQFSSVAEISSFSFQTI